MVTVQIIKSSTGNPVKNARIVLGINGGGNTQAEYTDANGEVHFPRIKPCKGQVYVNGRTKLTGRLEGRMVIYI